MTQPLANILLRIEQLLNAGRQQEARMLLVDYLQQNPASARGWWLLSLTLTDVSRQVACLQRVLRLDPENKPAQDKLNKLINQIPDSRSVSPFTSSFMGEEEEIADDLSLVPDWARPTGAEGKGSSFQPRKEEAVTSATLPSPGVPEAPPAISTAPDEPSPPSSISFTPDQTENLPILPPAPGEVESPLSMTPEPDDAEGLPDTPLMPIEPEPSTELPPVSGEPEPPPPTPSCVR